MNELESFKEWNNKIEEQQEVLNKVIIAFYKEIDLKVKMVNRGLLDQLSAKVIAPDNVLPITTHNFLEHLFLGDNEQRSYAKEYLYGFLKSVE